VSKIYEEARAFAYLSALKGKPSRRTFSPTFASRPMSPSTSAGTSAEKLFERRPIFDAPQMDALRAEPSYVNLW